MFRVFRVFGVLGLCCRISGWEGLRVLGLLDFSVVGFRGLGFFCRVFLGSARKKRPEM